jgi:hypothetical protein
MGKDELESALFWLPWIKSGKFWAGVLVAIGIAGEIIGDRLAAPLEKVVDDAREAEISRLNNNTARLQAENLELQGVMLPRRLSIIGHNEAPKAPTQFAGIRVFAGTEAWIQVAPDDEAQTLANDVVFILTWAGWKPRYVDESISHVPSRQLSEGIRVLTPDIEAAPHTKLNDPQAILGRAGDALASAFTNAGLGIRDIPVSHAYLSNKRDFLSMLPYFDPPLTAVFVEVGPRPIAMTLRLMERDRQNARAAQ